MAWLFLIAFEGIVGGVAVLLSLTFITFARMEKDIRRARMFIMADRIHRFLGAFTVGFIVLATTFAGAFLGIGIPAGVTVGAFFFFLAAIAYGVVELFFIVRPKRTAGTRGLRWGARTGRKPARAESRLEPSEDEPHASE